MKLFTDVKHTAMAIEHLIERRMAAMARAGRRAPHPLEVHNAILDRIEAQVTAGPAGSCLFPYTHVLLELLETDDGRTAALEAMFERAGGLHEEIRKRLAQRDCEIPVDLTCAVRRVRVTTPEWTGGAIYRLTFRRSSEEERDQKRSPAADLILALPSGDAGPAHRLGDGCTNIGRTPEVRDRRGCLIRYNAICIAGEHDPRATVSRCHAHLVTDFRERSAAACTLYDDASRYGTRVARDGRMIVVHPGTFGVRLRDGDEVYFGAARAVFRITTA